MLWRLSQLGAPTMYSDVPLDPNLEASLGTRELSPGDRP